MLFGGLILVALAAGAFFVVSFLTQIGDAIGNFFFNPNEAIEPNPHSGALAAVARGDYRRAITEYERVLANEPGDTLALSEIARIYCENLHEPEQAVVLLRSALGRDWKPNDTAFLSMRLAEIFSDHQHDLLQARDVLMRLIESLPGTRFAISAQRRLQEIDRQNTMPT
jgi:tetratricopeptide (TPR) repeat protein